MSKSNIDHLLETVVAKALGVKVLRPVTIHRLQRRTPRAHRPISHAA